MAIYSSSRILSLKISYKNNCRASFTLNIQPYKVIQCRKKEKRRRQEGLRISFPFFRRMEHATVVKHGRDVPPFPPVTYVRDYKQLERVTIAMEGGTVGSRFTYGVTCDPHGNIYATYGDAVLVWKVNTSETEVVAGNINVAGVKTGPRLESRFTSPLGVTWHKNALYVCHIHCVAIIEGNYVDFFAGNGAQEDHRDGPRKEARFNLPTHLSVIGEDFYVTDSFNHCIRKITPDGMVSTLRIWGTADPSAGHVLTNELSSLRYPRKVVAGPTKDVLLLIESSGRGVQVIDLTTKRVSTLYSRPNPFGFGMDMLYTNTGEVIVVDTTDFAIHLYNMNGIEQRLVSAGTAKSCFFNNSETSPPTSVCITDAGDFVFTSKNNWISCIKGMFPPRKSLEFDFSKIFESQEFSDLSLRHEASQQVFSFNSEFMNLFRFKNLKALEATEISFENCFQFLLLISGSATRDASCLPLDTLLTYLAISNQTEISTRLIGWLTQLVKLKIAFLTNPQLDEALQSSKNLPKDVFKLACTFINAEKDVRSADEQFGAKKREKAMSALDLAGPQEKGTDSIVTTSKTFDLSSSSSTEPFESQNNGAPKGEWSHAFEKVFLQRQMTELARKLRLVLKKEVTEDVSLENGKNENRRRWWFTFEVECEESGKVYCIKVSEWVLSLRWNYFRRMMIAGTSETRERTARLPSGFPVSLAIPLFYYIYCGRVDDENLTLEGCEYLLDQGGSLDILELDGVPKPGFGELIAHCHSKMKSNPKSADTTS